MPGESVTPENLSLTALQALSAATQALTEAVKALQGQSLPNHSFSLSPASRGILLGDLLTEFLLAKAHSERSPRYLRQAKVSLTSFLKGRKLRAAASLSAVEIEGWLNGQGWAAPTRRSYLIDVRSLLSFAVKRGYLAQNPALAVDLPARPDEPPGIHTPDQVQRILEIARAADLDVCRCLAIRYFAGLRASEAQALDESEIGLKYIEVSARKAKTRRRRLVMIQDNLRAWLALGGELPLAQANNRLCWVVKAILAAGLPWPKNAPRHSFCSYHLASHRSAAATALEAGHTEAMLFAHYRELVTDQAAKEYWAIRPSTA